MSKKEILAKVTSTLFVVFIGVQLFTLLGLFVWNFGLASIGGFYRITYLEALAIATLIWVADSLFMTFYNKRMAHKERMHYIDTMNNTLKEYLNSIEQEDTDEDNLNKKNTD